MLFRISENLIPPDLASRHNMVLFHLPSMTAIAASTGQPCLRALVCMPLISAE
jgi:hypothetical protein